MAAGAPSQGAGRRPAFIQAFALLAAFCAEGALFWVSTSRHYSWVFPRWSDQVQYLREAYQSYDGMVAGGFVKGAEGALALESPQGSLHGFLGMIAFAIGGPNRTAALAVNMAAFLCLQGATFVGVRRVSGSYSFAWAAVGLLAALRSPWSDNPGSAIDFRLDWMAACAFGVALAATVIANEFRSVRWAVILGLAVGVALLVRHLTAAYFGLTYAIILVWLLCRPDRLRRSGLLALSAACAVAVSAWAFWRSRKSIYSYYWVGHVVGRESAVRDSHMSPLTYSRWLFSEVLFQQLGAAALLAAGAAAALLVAGMLAERRNAPPPAPTCAGNAWPVVLAFLAAPAVALLVDPAKAPQALNILVPAVIWVIVLAWVQLGRRAAGSAVALICGFAGLAGAALFCGAELANPFTPGIETEYRDINALGDFLYFRSQESGLSRPNLAVTRVFGGMHAATFEVLGRERHHVPLDFVGLLPTGILPYGPREVMSRLAGSDFVCLVTRAPASCPFDIEMQSMLPEMRKWCDENLRHDGDLDAAEFAASIYERRSLARPRRDGGVSLPAMIAAASRGPAYAASGPPASPFLTSPRTIPWTTEAELRFVLRAAYGPVRFHAKGLPEGLAMDELTGQVRGRFQNAGRFTVAITTRNASGSATEDVTFLVSTRLWDASIDPPSRAVVGEPAAVGFSAFDAGGTLDFIDVTDRNTGRLFVRLPANEDERRNWQGSCQVIFREAGQHRVILRFVRYNPSGEGAYTFVDREFTAMVGR
jgi:hypothetical protein